MRIPNSEPKKRSKTRLFGGQIYFSTLRYFSWYINRRKYTQVRKSKTLPFLVFGHQTPLIRPLRNVDMWLQHNKIINLRLATAKTDSVVIRPRETFSFWRSIGKPAKSKGYVKGIVLHNGSFHPGIGGGLCQLSNLIYWMTLHTPLTVVERWRHDYDVFPDANRAQPFGSGATVAYNYIDLQIRNDTATEFQLRTWVGGSHLHGEWRSAKPVNFQYEIYESNHFIVPEWWGGYVRHNELRRKVFDFNGNQIGDELVTENHAIMMYDPLLQDGGSLNDY